MNKFANTRISNFHLFPLVKYYYELVGKKDILITNKKYLIYDEKLK
jgi:hypothetical protein